MKSLARLSLVFDRILNVAPIPLAFFIAFIMFTISIDVLLRYIAGRPLGPITELTTLLLGYIPFLGAAWLLRAERHVAIDVVLRMLKPRPQAILVLITSILGLVVTAILAWYGTWFTADVFSRGVFTIQVLKTPLWVYTIVIPIGCFLLVIQFLRRILRSLRAWQKNVSPGPVGVSD